MAPIAVYAAVTIPAGCTTPGDCDELTPTFQNLTVSGTIDGFTQALDTTSVTTFTGRNDHGFRIRGGVYENSEYALLSFGSSDIFAGLPLGQIGLRITATGSHLQFGTSSAYFAGITNIAMNIGPTGLVGIGNANPRSRLEVSSVIQSTPTDSPGTCSATVEGGMYYDASMEEPCFCNGTAWTQFDGGGACS